MTRLHLYDERTSSTLRIDEVAHAVHAITGLNVRAFPEFISYRLPRARRSRRLTPVARRLVEGFPDSFARALVMARVHDPLRRLQPPREPAPVEIAAERRALLSPGRTSVGILYDGALLQWLLSELLPASPALHLVLTARLFGSWSPDDSRWHAHTILCGEPSLISTSGLVQAPARPREYYQGQTLVTSRLVPREVVEAELQQHLADRMLRPDDPRLTQVVVGYALQAVAFHLTGSAFCPVPTCRLFNARRQEELLRAQCSPEAALCPEHQRLFETTRRRLA